VIRTVLVLAMLWQAGSPDALQHLQAGMNADKQRHFDVAIAEFRKATEIDPGLVAAFVNLGQAYMENHEYGSAITSLKQAVKLSPDLIAAHRLLGYALLSQGYAAEAIPHLARAQDATALGIAEIQTGNLKEAVENLQIALSKQPGDPDLLYYLGRASGLLSKQSVDTLLAAYPDSARAHEAMGENYYVLRQMPQAEKEFLAALQLRPDSPEVHLELGQVYAGSSQWEKAEEQFRAQTKLQPGNAEAFYRLGDSLLQQGKAHEARTALQQSDRLLPDMPETLYAIGKAAALDGDPIVAEKFWKQLLTIEKDTALAGQTHFALAGIYRKQGKSAEALKETQEFQRLQPNTTESPKSDSQKRD
jgi:tetratricopeptide (TPR) repeat protein